MGNEFTGPFTAYLDSKNLGHITRDPRQSNVLATVDLAIRSLKLIMNRNIAARRTGSWASVLQKSVTSYTSKPHESMMHTQPKDVDNNDTLQYDIEAKSSKDIKTNHTQHDDRVDRLKEEGAFRELLPRSTWQRAGQPRYGSKVHVVKQLVGNLVEDTEGQRHEVKLVAPAPVASAEQNVPREHRTGNPARMEEQRRELRPYAGKLVERLQQRDGEMSIQEVYAWMRAMVIGWWETMQQVRLTGQDALTRFVQLSPQKFEITGRGTRMKVRLK